MKTPTYPISREDAPTPKLREWIQKNLLLLSILLLAVILRFWQIGQESLWTDEIYSVQGVLEGNALPPENMVRPFYFILLKGWMVFGRDEGWLRSLSVIFDIGSVCLIYLLGCRTHSRATGLGSALLLTLSPIVIHYAQEVRMYSLGTFLGLVGTLAILEVLENQLTLRVMVLWAIARLLLLFTLPLGVTLLATDALIIAWRYRNQPKMWLNFGMWLGLVGLLWSPSFLKTVEVTPDFMSEWSTFQPRPTAISFSGMLTRFTIWPLKAPIDALSWFYDRFFKIYALILTALAIAPIISKQRSEKLIRVAAWAFLPQMAIFVASYLSNSLWVERYMLFTAPYALILLARGAIYAWDRQKILAISLVAVYLLVAGGGLFRYYTTESRLNWRAVVELLEENLQPGDAIAISGGKNVFDYYYQGSAPDYQLDIIPIEEVSASTTKEQLSNLPPFESRLWLIYERRPFIGDEGNELFGKVAREMLNVQRYEQITGLEIFVIAPDSASPKSN